MHPQELQRNKKEKGYLTVEKISPFCSFPESFRQSVQGALSLLLSPFQVARGGAVLLLGLEKAVGQGAALPTQGIHERRLQLVHVTVRQTDTFHTSGERLQERSLTRN